MRACLCLLLLASLGCAPAAPTVGADPETLAYLERTLWTPSQGGHVGCGYATLGADEQRAETYVWAVCEEVAGGSTVGGSSGPVVLVVDASGAVTAHRVPRDGAANGPDRERMFPRNVWAAIGDEASAGHRRLVARLSAAAQARAHPGPADPHTTADR